MCACERARCSPAIRRAAQWKLRGAASLSLGVGGGSFRARAGNPFAVALLAWARVGEWEQQPAGGSGGDRPAVRLGWSRVEGVLLARLRGCPEARSQGEGVRERTALPKGKAPPASFSE